MFNYFACRKIAEDELNKSLKDVVDLKKAQKMKCKLPNSKANQHVTNIDFICVRSNER